MYLRKSHAEQAVPFIFGQRDCSHIRQQEIGAGDAYVGTYELAAEFIPDKTGDLFRRTACRKVEFLVEELRYVLFRLMHGRGEDVIRLLARHLNDVFPQIGLEYFALVLFEDFVQLDLF